MPKYRITKDGWILWECNAPDAADAVQQYRVDLGAEAFDYDSENPNWENDLDVEIIDEPEADKND